MKWTYDGEADALYIDMSDEKVLESEEVHPDFILDFDDKGRIVGIEILNARDRIAPNTLTGLRAAE